MSMRLQYLISFKDSRLVVKIEEQGSRRVLYWDTLLAAAVKEDLDAIYFCKKHVSRFTRNLETVSFQQVEIAQQDVFECMGCLSKTGRVFYQGRPLLCDWKSSASVVWRGDDTGMFSACLRYAGQDIPAEACDPLFPLWCIWEGKAFPIQASVSWKWLEMFAKGPIVLEGVRKKRFLEDCLCVQWQTCEKLPVLFLSDATGLFANLLQEHSDWEKDLLEAGYVRKDVGGSKYFCPGDKVREALLLLLDVGWEIYLPGRKRLQRQTNVQWDLQIDQGMILARGSVAFQDKNLPLRTAMEALSKGRLWVDIDGAHAGLLDRKKGEPLEGEWIGDSLQIPRIHAAQLFPLLERPDVLWEDALLQAVRGLKEGGAEEHAWTGPAFKGELLPHQQKGLDWLDVLYKWGFSGLLADEMGLGKTVQVLAFFSRLRTKLPTLIAAPASLLFHWKAEIDRFLPESRILVLSDSCSDMKLIEHQYVIVSYARLRMDIERLSLVEWEVIVLDESNAIKTASTQTAQAAYRLNGRFRIALSGTPIENRQEEMTSQFRFLLPGLVQNMQSDARKIKPFILRRKKDEIPLPDKMEQIVWVEMGNEQSKFYESYVSHIRNGLLKKVEKNGLAVHRMEILEAILRLRQISADPRLLGNEIQGSKLERLLIEIEEALQEKRKILIYSQFTSMLALISKALIYPHLYLDGSMSPKERAERVKQFQEDPEIPLFLLSLKAGGVGLNLTAADYVLIFDPWWNESVENQAIDRVHRIGQKKNVIAKRYIAPATIEEKMLKLKADKKLVAAALLDQENFSWTEEDLLHLLS